jgi:hypothetical protein
MPPAPVQIVSKYARRAHVRYKPMKLSKLFKLLYESHGYFAIKMYLNKINVQII